MGSIVYRATKAQAIRDELANVSASSAVLAHRTIGSRLWLLAQAHTGTLAGRKWIGLTLIECRGGEAVVKCLDETLGPHYYDCPLSYLARADEPLGPHAGPWREQVRAFHANRSSKRTSIRCGARVAYGDHIYVLRHNLGRCGWEVARESDGVVFRMKSRQLGNAKVLPAQENLS